ncbi:hypothetical protein ILUMI_05740 [Ignelater luminosus]|uniref:RRM domain-containing protein n=1 Tax=Ignelater luminosus TaxID=2038154 RepID=A0A8K0DH35_IGNLU|nr:hypothetical protein ILUMI_05740 [Ignelater luminosus]
MANRPRFSNNKFKTRNQQRIPSSIKKRPIKRNVAKNKVVDARQRIISKKRNTVVDARDILAKMAKTQDARSKILKMREARKGENVVSSSIRAIGSNILQKTDRNGKISLITSKNKQSTNDINLAIQQQLGLIQNRKKATPRQGSTPVSPVARKTAPRNAPPVLISKTILNDVDYHPLPLQSTYDSYSHNYMSSDISNPRMIGAPLMTRRHQQLRDYAESSDWQTYSPFSRSRVAPSGYVDLDAPEDEEMPLVSPVKQTIFMQGTSRSSNVHSRLDTSPIQNQSHGIFAVPTKTKVVVPAGHRIVVSNLQQTVTQDDIRELFEDIGQLLAARLVRPGTAEVIYKNLKDAQKAVDTYHNRQLDGQPMKCLLVNKRPLNNPTGPALTTSKQDPTGLIVAMNKKSATAKPAEKLVPDLQTIHKVLFQRN